MMNGATTHQRLSNRRVEFFFFTHKRFTKVSKFTNNKCSHYPASPPMSRAKIEWPVEALVGSDALMKATETLANGTGTDRVSESHHRSTLTMSKTTRWCP